MLCIVLFSMLGFSQKKNPKIEGRQFSCGADVLHAGKLRESRYRKNDDKSNADYAAYALRTSNNQIKSGDAARGLVTTMATTKVTLPIVFHDLTSSNVTDKTYQNNGTLITAVVNKLNSNFSGTNATFCNAKINLKGEVIDVSKFTNPLTSSLEAGNTGQMEAIVAMALGAKTGYPALSNYPTNKFINVYIVDDIKGSVAGFASMPSSHGEYTDGIFIEKNWISFKANTTTLDQANLGVLTHEMGHYLGLYHTFGRCTPEDINGVLTLPAEDICSSCKNDNCLFDGDMVCDTPPERTVDGVLGANTCTTDVTSQGDGSNPKIDELDSTNNFMDYGRSDDLQFTQGQIKRMNFMIDSELGPRNTLLNSNFCTIDCKVASTCTIKIQNNNVDGKTNTKDNYPFPAVTLSGASVSANFNAVLTGGTCYNKYEWKVIDLDATPQTTSLQTSTSNTCSILFNKAGNYRIVLKTSLNSNSSCFKESSFNIQVLPPAKANCITMNWENTDFKRISYEGGWANNSGILINPLAIHSKKEDYDPKVNNIGNDSYFAILNNVDKKIPITDPNFKDIPFPTGVNGLPVNAVMRIGKVQDGNTEQVRGAAAYVTYTFKPTKDNAYLKVHVLGQRKIGSYEDVRDSSISFTSAIRPLQSDFGMTCKYKYKLDPNNPTFSIIGASNEFTSGNNQLELNNYTAYTIDKTNTPDTTVKFSKWESKVLDFTLFIGHEVTVTFYARSNIADGPGYNHAYAYFAFECLSGAYKPIDLNLPNQFIDCSTPINDNTSCFTYNLWNNTNYPKENWKDVIKNSNFNSLNKVTIDSSVATAMSFPGGYPAFSLCKKADNLPSKTFEITYRNPQQTIVKNVTITQGFTHDLDICLNEEDGGTYFNPEDKNRVITFCDTAELKLKDPCFKKPGVILEYKWEYLLNGNWLPVNTNWTKEKGKNNQETLILGGQFPSISLNEFRRVVKYKDPYCQTPEWLPSDIFKVFRNKFSTNGVSKTSINSSSNICENGSYNLNTTFSSKDIVKEFNSTFNRTFNTKIKISYWLDEAHTKALNGDINDASGNSLSNNTNSCEFNVAFNQTIPDIDFFIKTIPSRYNFDIYVMVESDIDGCLNTESMKFYVDVTSAIGGVIAVQDNCADILNFTGDTENETKFRAKWQWRYSYDKSNWTNFTNSIDANLMGVSKNFFTFPNAADKVYIQRVANHTDFCMNSPDDYSNIITIYKPGTPVSVKAMGPYCQYSQAEVLPTTSLNDGYTTGTWSPAVIDTNTVGVFNYTFTPTNTCVLPSTIQITIRPPATQTFDQLDPIKVGSSFVLPSVSKEGTPGTWLPEPNSQQTTTYTFTPEAGYCAAPATMTVVVNKCEYIGENTAYIGCFTALDTENLFPVNINGISGTWSPAFNYQPNSKTLYTFTPNDGTCNGYLEQSVVFPALEVVLTQSYIKDTNRYLFNAENSLATKDNYSLDSYRAEGVKSDITLQAGQSIQLLPNTHIKPELDNIDTFIAKIGCWDYFYMRHRDFISSEQVIGKPDSEIIKESNTVQTNEFVSVYPNPSNNIVNVVLNNGLIVKADLLSLEGRTLMSNTQINKNEHTFSVQNLPNGIYLLRITTNDGTILDRKVIRGN